MPTSRAQEHLPDVAFILVEQLVRHGMEHEDNAVRLWSTVAPPRLMVRAPLVERFTYEIRNPGHIFRQNVTPILSISQCR